ncbi:MAG: hypothetical protein Q9195_002204 [Heterodermia aff. obscurata]
MSGLLPLSKASIIVGFISFAFTVSTFLNVFWSSLSTMKNAPREMKGYLDNLRSELYGERDYFKKAMRQLLNDSIRHLMQDFKRLERPFLEVPPEDEEDKDVEKTEESSPFRVKYAPMDLRHRYIWLRSKNDVLDLADQVTRIQSRRIAFDTNTLVQSTHDIEKRLRDVDDRLWDVEEHLMGERLEDGKVYVRRRYHDS